ncbi:sensor histidine kinase [Nonomuraea sp. NPDC049309]|uniref:sensor histidine kinase n=1 Tax=Nonomuraea sp. NPDC049309 TaxID=3364350 RepID=UPI0037142FC9
MIGLLRSDGDPQQAHLPVPGMADLPKLADDARSAGVDVHLTVSGDTEPPPAVAMSVYRIVQQALTNVVTHAAPTRCTVTVGIDHREAAIDVIDDGPVHGRPPRAGPGGHGLIGMRELVKLYGGTFSARPTPRGLARAAPL